MQENMGEEGDSYRELKPSDYKLTAISDAAILALVTVTGYLLVYVHDAAFVHFFNLPETIISISPTQIFTVGYYTGFLAGLMLFAIALLRVKVLTMSLPTVMLWGLRVTALAWSLAALALVNEIYQYAAFAVCALVFLYVEFVFPKTVKSLLRRSLDKRAADGTLGDYISRARAPRVASMLTRRYGVLAFFILPIVLLLCGISMIHAKIWAMTRESYFVTEQGRVILAHYGDDWYAARLDIKKREVYPDVTVIRMEKGEHLRLRVVKVGPLRPVPIPGPHFQ